MAFPTEVNAVSVAPTTGKLGLTSPSQSVLGDQYRSGLISIKNRITGNPFNVADYGAVGDGTTDDTTAVTAAVTAATTTGGIVYVPSSFHCKIASAITIPPGVGVQGVGTSRALGSGFVASASGSGLLFTDTGTSKGTCSGNFYFDANSLATTPIRINGVDSGEWSNIRIENSAGKGLWLVGTQNSQFTKISVESCVTDGFNIDGGAGGNAFLTCNAYNCAWALRFTVDTTPPAGAYTAPTANGFYQCIFEVPATGATGVVRHVNGVQNLFVGCILQSALTGAMPLFDATGGGRIRFIGCDFIGDAPKTKTGIKLVSGVDIYVGGLSQFLNLAYAIEAPSGSVVYPDQMYLNNTTALLNGNTNIILRQNIRYGIDTDRDSGTDVAFATGLASEGAPKWYMDATGTMSWSVGGTDYTGDIAIYRGAAGRLTCNNQIQALDGLTTRTVAGVVSDASFTVAPVTGTLAVDTTNSRLYVRVGSTWKSVVVA